LIVLRERTYRQALAVAIAAESDFDVVACAPTAAELCRQFPQLDADVCLVDFDLPERTGLREADLLTRANPSLKVLMMGCPELEADVLECVEAGAAGYVVRGAPLEDLLANLAALLEGKTLCSARVAAALFSRVTEMARYSHGPLPRELVRLTPREVEVLGLIDQQLSNKEIAVRLSIEVQTVKNHVHNILEKLHLERRQEAARFARESGLLGGGGAASRFPRPPRGY
jgi:DNA-binding NarL/FixJ family response regulator